MDKPAPPASRAVPRPGEGKRGTAGYLGYLLHQAAAASRLATDRALAGPGITTAQFAVLTMLDAYPGASGADIARLAQLTPQTVNQIIRNLERIGALARVPHPAHGRVLQLHVTPAGRSLLAAAKAHANTINHRLAAGLSPAEEAIIRNWLVRVAVELGPEASEPDLGAPPP